MGNLSPPQHLGGYELMWQAAVAGLRERGHDVRVGEPWSEGRMSACSREFDARGRLVLRAGANPRGMQGYAAGR